MLEHYLPSDIERSSLSIIDAELRSRGIRLPPESAPVIRRCIHATADFDYAQSLCFTADAVRLGAEALRRGVSIVTDTNMAAAGISRPCLKKLGADVRCFMAEPFISEAARQQGCTRASAAMDYAAEYCPGAVLAVGNAPTALIKIADLIQTGLRPALVIAVPVGFVNVVESKERVFAVCKDAAVPAVVARGRKGGSTVAAAICNALLYIAADMQDPSARGWN